MINPALFWIILNIYIIGWIFSIYAFFKKNKPAHYWGEGSIYTGFFIHIILIVSRYLNEGALPLSSLTDLLILFALIATLVYLIADYLYPNEMLEMIFPSIAVFLLFSSNLVTDKYLIPKDLVKESPIIFKTLLFTHVSSFLIGQILFAMACVTSIFFLYQERQIKNKKVHLLRNKIPSLGFLDRVNFKAITVGFIFMTIGLLLGMVVGLISTGKTVHFSWRQVFPILTWWIYALFLLDRSIRGVRGKVTAIWSISGFLVVICSFVYEIFFLISRA